MGGCRRRGDESVAWRLCPAARRIEVSTVASCRVYGFCEGHRLIERAMSQTRTFACTAHGGSRSGRTARFRCLRQ